MKALQYLKILLYVIVIEYGCNYKPSKKERIGPHNLIVVAMDTAAFYKLDIRNRSVNMQSLADTTMKVLKRRLTKIGIDEDMLDISENGKLIEIKIWNLLQQDITVAEVNNMLRNGNLSFWETFNASELTSCLISANKILEDLMVNDTTRINKNDSVNGNAIHNLLVQADPLFKLLSIPRNDEGPVTIKVAEGPVLGSAILEDTAKVGAYFRIHQIRALFPLNLKFMWERPNNKNEPRYQLIALKVPLPKGFAPLSGNIITEAWTEFQSGESHPDIAIGMTPVAGSIWARLTADNIGKNIAIVVDGMVYSAPQVLGRIERGRSTITGNFDVHEAKDMATILSSGYIPVPIKIVKETIEN
jgi:SecD/SecF fusion protein